VTVAPSRLMALEAQPVEVSIAAAATVVVVAPGALSGKQFLSARY
jgi:hypothetical protein